MASDGSRPGLTSLAPELILRIVDFTDPPTQLSLACASRRLFSCCHRFLLRHQAAHARYACSSDLDPATVPHLLRSALGLADPLDVWHVRSFELWGARDSWDEWRPFDLDHETPSRLKDGEPLRWELREGEADRLLSVFAGEMKDGIRAFAEEGLRRGADWYLKAVLLALLPRLMDLKVVAGAGNKALAWLAHAMAWSCNHSTPKFAALRSVAVNVSSGTWRDSLHRGTYDQILVSILHLPQLDSLYFSGLNMVEWDLDEGDVDYVEGHELLMGGYPFDGPDNDPTDRLPASIPLRRLILDDIGNVEHEFREELLAAPRALEALSLRGRNQTEHADSWASDAGSNQRESMRRLMLYNPEAMNGYRCDVWYPDVLTEGLPRLRQACAAVSDVELQSIGGDFTETLREAFPRATEVLMLFGETGVHVEGQEFPTQFLDDALAEVIHDKVKWYPVLKAVFLDQVEEATFQDGPGEKACFPKAMEAGKREGVDVFTKTNGKGRAKWEKELLAPLGKFDLRTGPHYREAREGMVMDFGTGEWVEDCECCGRCERCLRVYKAEVWDALREREGA